MPQLSAAHQPAVQSRATAAADFASDRQRARAALRALVRVEAVAVALLCLALLCLFYFEVIFENRTFLPFGSPGEVMGGAPPWQFSGTIRSNPYRLDAGGSAWQLEPWARVVSDSYASGQVPLWNPHQFFGTPLAGDAQPGVFDLLRLPALITARAWGWDLYYLSQSALCLVLTYAFGRSVGLRPTAAFIAAAGYAFSGFMFIRGNMHYAEIYHLLPGILWGTEQIVRASLRSGILILAVALALSVFAGMPEVTLLTLLYAASFGAFRVVWSAVGRRSIWFGVHRSLLIAVAWIVGIGLAAPMIVPLLEYIRQSYSIHPPERGLGMWHLPLRALSYIGVPFINGLPSAPLTANPLMPLDDYSGATVVLLAVVGCVCIRRLSGSVRAVAVFALSSALLWGAKLYGVPGIDELGRLPLLVQTLIYIFGTPLLSLSLAILAGVGVHAVSSGMVDFRRAYIAGLLFIGYLALAVRLNWQTLLSAGLRHAASTVGLAGVVGLGVLICLTFGRRWPRPLATGAVAAIVIGELFILSPHDVYSDRYDSLARPPFVAWLQQQVTGGQPFRVFSNDGLLYPDYAGAFGLDDPRVVDGLWPLRTWEFVKTFLSPSVTDRYVGGFGHPELPTNLFANKWLNLSNVRYILRPADQSPSDATLAQTIVAAHYPATDMLHVSQFTIDGKRREVLVERTPGDVTFDLHPSAAQPTLSFSVGLDPELTTSSVQFIAAIQSDGQQHDVFNRTLDPANSQDRSWVPGSVDLGPYIGRDVTLVLQTRSQDGSSSSPGWGDLHFMPLPDQSQFRQVYDGEISIWENTRAAPRAFLVGDVSSVASPSDAIARMEEPNFDPLVSAVVDSAAPPAADLPSSSAAAGTTGTATITSYGPQDVRITVDAQRLSMLVLTDSYYPGWSAAVDGAPTPVLPTDLAFRGVRVPSGQHQVTFSYTPASVSIGLLAAAAALVLLGLITWRLPLAPIVAGAGAPNDPSASESVNRSGGGAYR